MITDFRFIIKSIKDKRKIKQIIFHQNKTFSPANDPVKCEKIEVTK